MTITIPRSVLGWSLLGTITGVCILIKDYTKGKTYKTEERMTGKTVVVTGANGGIGKETSMDLAKKGARVIMACRNMRACESVKDEIIQDTYNQSVTCKYLDLSSIQSIHKFADEIKKERRLDVLINNAGIMMCKKALTADGFEIQLGVNHLGSFLLTHLLLDKLKESAPSRIVNLTSLSYKIATIEFEDLNSVKNYNEREAYKQSKMLQVLCTKELAKRLQGMDVTANLVYPGVVKTNIGRHTGYEKSLVSWVILGPIAWLVRKSPVQGAQTVIYAAVDPSLEKVTGQMLIDLEAQEIPYLSDTHEADTKRIWAISERWTRLT